MAQASFRQNDRQLAVALRYDEARDTAPRVTARGSGYVARKILEIAERDNVPVREDPDLLDALRQLDLGEVIPAELYPAVAEVLAWVYRMNQRYRRAPQES
jgi:flagellar biosynthesis protein